MDGLHHLHDGCRQCGLPDVVQSFPCQPEAALQQICSRGQNGTGCHEAQDAGIPDGQCAARNPGSVPVQCWALNVR